MNYIYILKKTSVISDSEWQYDMTAIANTVGLIYSHRYSFLKITESFFPWSSKI